MAAAIGRTSPWRVNTRMTETELFDEVDRFKATLRPPYSARLVTWRDENGKTHDAVGLFRMESAS